MPGLGYTLTEDAVRAEYERMDADDFARAYLCLFPDERPAEEWRLVDRDGWAATLDPRAAPADRSRSPST
jgi:hypothetical protein